ncbi:MAG TPA: response regulator, partial [Anaerolineales bacterium]|nr:response regulator [Anaerolineales bacterium]
IAPTNPSLLVRTPSDMLGKTFHELLPIDIADSFLSKVQEALISDTKVQFEYELAISGQLFWFLATLTKLDENSVFWVARDITERKKSEEAIQRRNQYLAVSAEIGKLVTSILDLSTIFARTVNLITDRFNVYHAAIFIVEETGFNAVLKEGTGEAGAEMKQMEHSLQLNDKSIVGSVASTGQLVVANNVLENPLYMAHPLLAETRSELAIPLKIGTRVIGVIDMQSRELNSFNEDEVSVLQTLADQVAVAIDNARSFELSQQAVMEMREADRLKSQFLANMSHELRTPLNSIIGFSRVILKGIDGPVTELMQQDLTAIYNSGQHLLGLINDILDSAKIEAGKMELAFDEVNIQDLTHSVLSTMSGLIKDKPIEMRQFIEQDTPTVRADAIRIRQVMINLLSNAAKFTEEGSITVNVAPYREDGKKLVKISVTDTGSGISIQDQEKLFQAFSQVDASPTRKSGGTGLGLSICKQLINMHGGQIWVESKESEGSTFHFTLPLFNKENELAEEGNKVILTIDDDPQVIGLYERYLQPQGYHVHSLTDPSRAVEVAKQVKPFAITLDIMMPGTDGWTVLDTLKSDSATRNIPVIICSIVEDIEKGFNLGASDYLVKPILEEDLVNSLDRLNADGSIREVLVIDDNPNDLRLIGKMLNDDGRYKPILAEGGRNGWTIISSGTPPHAIILDLFMPEMDGIQILEQLQADKRLRDIPTIVISGMDVTPEQKNKLKEFGQRLLTKGAFNESELLTSIQRSLDRLSKK